MTGPVFIGTFRGRDPISAQSCTTSDVWRAADVMACATGRPRFAAPYDAIRTERGSAAALVAAYVDHGARCLDDVSGTFAFALFDAARGETLLAVDRLGIETLCFAIESDVVRFSSDAARLAAALPNGGTLDPQSIFDYLYFHCIPSPRTIFRGVTRLPPGHLVRITDGQHAVAPYWQPSYAEQSAGDVPTLEREFLAVVRHSVEIAVDGARKPGAFLSGGTDSSTVSGMLTAATGAAAHTYSIGFDAEGFDEMSYARIAAKRFGTDHHEYYITPADLVASIPTIAAAYDQPFGNSSVLPTYYCAKMAAADGVDRILGGDGGDELFGGNTRYAKQRVFDYFERAPAALKGIARTLLAPAALKSIPGLGKARSYVSQADVPLPDRMQTYNLLTRIGISEIFEPDFIAGVDTDAPMKAMRAWYARSNANSLVNRMLAFDLKYTLADNDLPKVMNACRLAGVDVAFPFLDDSVVAFSERLHPDLKLKGLKLRWFFKHALRDFLPPEIITKSKHGFGLPFGIWLSRDKALNELAFASLESLKQRGIVRIDFIDQLRADLLADHATYYGELVWVLMMLEQWLQTHQPSRAVTH
jgi:asparagine synthase (glutamine-hydrolysing)